jgi:transcriptional regulator
MEQTMYVPAAFREDDQATLIAFMAEHSFGTLVSLHGGEPLASHLPFVIDVQDQQITLWSHVARANPQWQALLHNSTALAIFSGPHAYVSPTLYEKREAVPTWNYIAVHAYGRARVIDPQHAPDAMQALLDRLIALHEPTYGAQWRDLPPRFREGMLRGTIGVELAVTRLEGKFKLSQNRSPRDQQTVAHALSAHDDPAIAGVGMAMQRGLSRHNEEQR